MQFNSLSYVCFLPLAFLLYWGFPVKYRNVWIVLASFFFYGTWSWAFLSLMIFTGLANWVAARILENEFHRKAILVGTLSLNFLILGIFKYYNFFVESLVDFLALFDFSANLTMLNVVLPVGISFYTFQVSGYVIDVYQRKLRSVNDIWHFFAFLSFFPQLVAGPIEPAEHLLPQLKREHRFDYAMATSGMRLILWGLMKKMLLADNCGNVADMIFDHYQSCTTTELWMGAVFFSFQIYGDFSGYTDMAIGSAKLFGIELMQNFRHPYLSFSIPDFWRNWHISLMMWFRNYIYIPLGGNKLGVVKKWRNVFVVFTLSGLWHGAGWTYVVWGIYHALLFIPYSLKFLREPRKGVLRILQTGVTFFLVCIGWVVFRSQNLADAIAYLSGMFQLQGGWNYGYSRLPIMLIMLFFLCDLLSREDNPLDFKSVKILTFKWVRFILYFFLFVSTLWLGGKSVQFIYFQF